MCHSAYIIWAVTVSQSLVSLVGYPSRHPPHTKPSPCERHILMSIHKVHISIKRSHNNFINHTQYASLVRGIWVCLLVKRFAYTVRGLFGNFARCSHVLMIKLIGPEILGLSLEQKNFSIRLI